MRARVLEACRQLGVEVREEAPSMHRRVAWREAFLTSSLRLVQPLRCVACAPHNVWRHEPWALELPGPLPGPVTSALQAALLRLMPSCCASEL